MVTAGSNMGFINALLAIADPGDEFILPVPFYFNHEMAVVMAECDARVRADDYRLPARSRRHRAGDHAADARGRDGVAQ